MTDIPIIFSAPMVQALLAGRKTMTRRLAFRPARKGEASGEGSRLGYVLDDNGFTGTITKHERPSPWQRVKVDDRLWVRESAAFTIDQGTGKPAKTEWFLADGENPYRDNWSVKSRPSIHMPRWASRLTLIVTGTKTESLQDISEADALAEGVEFREDCFGTWNPDGTMRCGGADNAREAFRCLWLNLHGTGSWETNPPVVVLSVQVVKANIGPPDAIAA